MAPSIQSGQQLFSLNKVLRRLCRGYWPVHCRFTKGECRRLIRPAPGEVDRQIQQPREYNTGVTGQVFSKSSQIPRAQSGITESQEEEHRTIVRNAKSLRVRIRVRVKAEKQQ